MQSKNFKNLFTKDNLDTVVNEQLWNSLREEFNMKIEVLMSELNKNAL